MLDVKFKMEFVKVLNNRKGTMTGYKAFLRDYLRLIIEENMSKKLDEIQNIDKYFKIRKINSCMMKYYSKMKVEEIERMITDIQICYGIESVAA